jgi:hypothetical protein
MRGNLRSESISTSDEAGVERGQPGLYGQGRGLGRRWRGVDSPRLPSRTSPANKRLRRADQLPGNSIEEEQPGTEYHQSE